MRHVKFNQLALTVLLAALAAGGQAFAQEKIARQEYITPGENTAAAATDVYLPKAVRRELVTLPFYNLFDWLEFEVQPGGAVVLRGQVVRPTTRSDAAGRVKNLAGVTSVDNQIEVLPLSPNDDRLRLALYRTVLGYRSPLSRYANATVPSIHIIVKHGRATLKGVVATKGDSDLANIRANTVPGLFEVNNELRVERAKAR